MYNVSLNYLCALTLMYNIFLSNAIMLALGCFYVDHICVNDGSVIENESFGFPEDTVKTTRILPGLYNSYAY